MAAPDCRPETKAGTPASSRRFAVGGAPFRLEGPDEAVSALLPLLRSTLVVDARAVESGSGEEDLRIAVELAAPEPAPVRRIERLHRSADLSIWSTSCGYELRAGKTRLLVHEDPPRAELALDDGLWQIPLPQRRELLLLGFLMLLRGRRRFGLHANAVATASRSALIVGPSGCGKTSLALGLIGQGWRFVSDDALLLRQRNGAVVAHAFRRGFSCPATAVRQMPRLARTPGTPLPDDKRLVDLAQALPERFVSTCTPGLLLFPRIDSADRSVIAPCSSSEAMAGLMEQSPGIMTDAVSATRQMELLAALVRGTAWYRIGLGRDLFERPERIARLVESLEVRD